VVKLSKATRVIPSERSTVPLQPVTNGGAA
jgi:hypothetical protein